MKRENFFGEILHLCVNAGKPLGKAFDYSNLQQQTQKGTQQDKKRQHFFYLPCYQSLEGAYHEKH